MRATSGKRIILYPTEVEFKGERMLGIRVRMRPPDAQKPEITDDDISF